jgi:hypothetical protein
MSATAETTTGQLAECTVTGCTWKGPVAEAPDHPCPYPKAVEGLDEEQPQAEQSTTEERRPWQEIVAEELDEFEEPVSEPFVIVVDRPDGDPQTLGYRETRDGAEKAAVESATRGGVIGEIHVETVGDALAFMAEVEKQRVQEEANEPERVLETDAPEAPPEEPAPPAPETEDAATAPEGEPPPLPDPEPEDAEPVSDEGAKDEPAPLFDRSKYNSEELALPKIDGEGIDKIRVDFSGSVMLNRMDKADVALFRKLRLAGEVELRVAGKVSAVKDGFTTSKEGDLDALVETRSVKIDTLYVLTPEEL